MRPRFAAFGLIAGSFAILASLFSAPDVHAAPFSTAYGGTSAGYCTLTDSSVYPMVLNGSGSYTLRFKIRNDWTGGTLDGIFLNTETQDLVLSSVQLFDNSGALQSGVTFGSQDAQADYAIKAGWTGWTTGTFTTWVVNFTEPVRPDQRYMSLSIHRSGVSGGSRCIDARDGQETLWWIALADKSCPSGYLGTYPYCSYPPASSSSGGGTTTVSGGMSQSEARTIAHDYSLKAAGLSLALLFAAVILYSFRWRPFR